MKEYLDTAKCYKYVKDTAKRSEDWIKIPSGAEIAFKNIYGSGISFTTEDWMTDFSDGYKIPRSVKIGDQYKSGVVWSRHTQPEELPFVDDDCVPKKDHGSPLIRPFISVDNINIKVSEVSESLKKGAEDIIERQSRLYKNAFNIEDFVAIDDKVNNPSHYKSGNIECIDAIESSMTSEAFAGFLKGNVQKYMWRYENKGGVESLQKAQWYLNRLILLQSAHD